MPTVVCTMIALSVVAGLAQQDGHDSLRSEAQQRGRARYVIEHVPLSLVYSGLLEGVVQPRDAKLGVGLYMLSAGGLIAGSFAIPTTPAQAHLSIAYGYRGMLTGAGLAEVLGVRDAGARCFTALGSGVAAEFWGYRLARGMSAGQAQLLSTYTDVGILGGGLLWGMTFQGDPVPWLLLGEGVGIGAGYLRQRSLSYTEGQAMFVRTTGVLGALAPVGLTYALAGSDGVGALNGRFASGTALLGSLGALYYAERHIGNYPLTAGGGVACAGLAAAGALLGGGLAFLVSPNDYYGIGETSQRMIVGGATLGAVGGLAAGLSLAKRSAALTQGSWLTPNDRLAVNWTILSASALSYAKDKQFSAPGLVTFRF
ncbi:hypothetical protein FJY68_00535 [candidate division WOR-3 bacterium]|uniref:Uncharacterized protein n=1 Tax=candidate division WOR-3 bacterium TaxID=2052148 RepID=A0A937XBG3_UNCW3|nr:hypothetical protein [candidate division WOR-3 bacterium]